VVNGKNNRPRLSLLVSSHLMLGLVVLLNRKHQYLYGKKYKIFKKKSQFTFTVVAI
jgi:hypothetical protein